MCTWTEKIFYQELKGHAAAKAQGQNNKRTYAKVIGNLWFFLFANLWYSKIGPPSDVASCLTQALAGSQPKEPASKTARVEPVKISYI